jgi:hypothetical protein
VTAEYNGAPPVERRLEHAAVGDSKTSLVDTRIALADAPEAALRLYQRLVDSGAIEAQLRDDVRGSLGLVFPVRDDFAGFDAVIEERFRPRIHGVEIHATGRDWRTDNGVPTLVKHDNAPFSLFYNFQDGFVMTCPACRHSVDTQSEDVEIIQEALTAWCTDPDKTSMVCPACERPILIRDWGSANNTFAAGHLGFTLWGANLTALAETPSVAAATNIRRLIGDPAEEYAVVFCHI